MANWTPEELGDGLADIIEAVSGAGAVVTDKKFTETSTELLRLLKSQTGDGKPLGWIVSWEDLPTQVEDSSCEIVSTYRFNLAFLYPYLNDSPGNVTSEVLFKRLIFAVNEALNGALALGLDNRVRHQMLQSTHPFDVIGWGEGKNTQVSHFAEFTLDIAVINKY